MVDGTTRTPKCPYCATSSFLPDDLWRALRPTPKAEPFYLWVDPTWYASWLRLKGRQTRAVLLAVVLTVFGVAAAFAATAFFWPAKDVFGTDDIGGPVPWYGRALITVTFSWMIAWGAGLLMARWTRPKRERSGN